MARGSSQSVSGGGRPVRVLVSFPAPRPTTNPYIVMLGESLASTEGVEMTHFSFRTALIGRYDVFHAHWPEILMAGDLSPKVLARRLMTVLFFARLALTRTAVVRTVHNLELPSGISRFERGMLRWFERLTTLRIRLNEVTELPSGTSFATIPHGHYRDWFASYPKAAAITGRIGYFGLIRRYKGVEALIEAFSQLPDPDLSLHVAGRPSNDELADTIRAMAAADERIGTHLAFLDDAELVEAVTTAELIVLPYRFMHNSGATLTALSLDRPVLVPDTEVNRLLEREVGPGWVFRYGEDVTPATLTGTLAASRDADRSPRPDLSGRDWDDAGRQHLAAYRRALTRR